MNRFTNKFHTNFRHQTKIEIERLKKEIKMNEQERQIISMAWDSWIDAIKNNSSDSDMIAHHAKRLKYLIDWAGLSIEMNEQTEQTTNGWEGLNIEA